MHEFAMLRTTPRSLWPLQQLRRSQSQALHQQLRAVSMAPRSSGGAVSSRFSPRPQWRAIHSTRPRSSAEKPPGSEKPAWDGTREWGFLSREQFDKEDVDNIFFLLFAGGCAYIAYLELRNHLPYRTNPNHLMKESLEIIKAKEELVSKLGAPLLGQGERVFKWHRVESVKIKDTQDDTPGRLRIKYYLTGSNGSATVFAEVTEGTAKDEYNYLVVQFNDTKEVVTVIDHRDITHATPHETDAHAPSAPQTTISKFAHEPLRGHE